MRAWQESAGITLRLRMPRTLQLPVASYRRVWSRNPIDWLLWRTQSRWALECANCGREWEITGPMSVMVPLPWRVWRTWVECPHCGTRNDLPTRSNDPRWQR
jgi:hypothetical protein